MTTARTLSWKKALCVGLAAAMLTTFALLFGCATAPHALEFTPVPETSRPHRVFAVGHGWHVGLVLPVAPLAAHHPALATRFKHTSHLEIGWGDKGFYQAQEITSGLTMRAMFYSTGAVMHVVAVPLSANLAFDYFPASNVVEVCLSDHELRALNEFVQRSFLRDAHANAIPMKPGIYGDSQFYEGEGRYHFLNTCNKWVAKGLASAGFSIDPTFTLTSASVLDHLKASGRAVRTMEAGVMVPPLAGGGVCK